MELGRRVMECWNFEKSTFYFIFFKNMTDFHESVLKSCDLVLNF